MNHTSRTLVGFKTTDIGGAWNYFKYLYLKKVFNLLMYRYLLLGFQILCCTSICAFFK